MDSQTWTMLLGSSASVAIAFLVRGNCESVIPVTGAYWRRGGRNTLEKFGVVVQFRATDQYQWMRRASGWCHWCRTRPSINTAVSRHTWLINYGPQQCGGLYLTQNNGQCRWSTMSGHDTFRWKTRWYWGLWRKIKGPANEWSDKGTADDSSWQVEARKVWNGIKVFEHYVDPLVN